MKTYFRYVFAALVGSASVVVLAFAQQGALPGMPPVLNPKNVYSETAPGKFSPAVAGFPSLVYVPNTKSDTVDVINPETFKIVDHFALPKKNGRLMEPQHIIPSWNLKKLWVAQDLGDQLTAIDPATGKKGETITVDDPYNMYNTPDGKYVLVMAEREQRIDFRDPETMKIVARMPVNCKGVNHADFTPDGRIMIATCEFSSELIKVDLVAKKVLAHLPLLPKGMPQDCRLTPDGKHFLVANMEANGVHVIDAEPFRQVDFIKTGKGTHGIYFSRDAKYAYVSNRGEGSVTLIDTETLKIDRKWMIPGGGSPDMGGVSADGKTLWLSGRYHSEVYVFDTATGKLRARIKVGDGPHGLCIYPQPGRYSLGHTGNLR